MTTDAAKSTADKELTLFMLVTNRDCLIANYSIYSYRKLYRHYKSFSLQVYANCLTEENKHHYFSFWRKLPYVQLIDNQSRGTIDRRKGERFLTPEGIGLRYDDNCEHYDEVWTREHRRSTSPLWGTVDADFEVLEGEFLPVMLERLRSDDRVVAVSTDYGAGRESHFDSYSNEIIRLNERWDTWCCIYKHVVAQYLDEASSFYFEKRLPDGRRDAFDSYANFQQLLKHKYGYKLEALSEDFQRQFIHYGAFSKNKSINRRNVAIYRKLAITAKRGVFGGSNRVAKKINRISQRLALRIFQRLFRSAVQERRHYDYK